MNGLQSNAGIELGLCAIINNIALPITRGERAVYHKARSPFVLSEHKRSIRPSEG